MMHTIDEYVEEALLESGIIADQLDAAEGARIRNQTVAKFATGTCRCLWERLADSASVHREDAWTWLASFVRDQCFLFFDIDDSEAVYGFQNGHDLVSMLYCACGFVFYVTDSESSYVIAFNDHDYLIASGAAKSWLEREKALRS